VEEPLASAPFRLELPPNSRNVVRFEYRWRPGKWDFRIQARGDGDPTSRFGLAELHGRWYEIQPSSAHHA